MRRLHAPLAARDGSGTPIADRVRAGLSALTLVAATLLGAALPAAPASAALDDDEAIVSVQLVSLAPEVTRPGDTLTVVVEIQNTGPTEITSPQAELSVSPVSISTRNTLAAWEENGLEGSLGSSLATTMLPGPLPPGATAVVTLEAPADSMQLRTGVSSWGPRGLAVAVTGDTASTAADERLGVLRTYVVWFPVDDAAVNPVQVSVLVPVVGPPVDTLAPQVAEETLAEETAAGGRLATLLASTQGLPGVTLAVDPVLVPSSSDETDEASDEASDEPTSKPTDEATDDPAAPDPTEPEATWVETLLAQAAEREVYALPRYDQDWGAFADAGLPAPASSDLPTALSAWRTDLSWPAEAEPDTATLGLVVSSGAPTVVVGPQALMPDVGLTYTPTGRATATTDAGDAALLVPDATLSALLEAPAQTTPASARQRVLAELAVIARERPGDQRHVFVTVPRDWSPDATTAQAQLASMDTVPWSSLQPVSTLAAAPDPGVSRAPLPEAASSSEGELDPAIMRNLRKTSADISAFSSIVPDPAEITAPLDEAVLAATSIGWRSDVAGRSAAIDRIHASAASTTASITILGQSDFTLISTGSAIPIDISNTLTQPATVIVALDPDDPRLVAESSVTVTVPAGSDASVSIPVKAIGSGDVTVNVQILAQSGAVVAHPFAFEVRVRAGWETIGTVVVTVLLVLFLAGGVIRTIHRGRSDRRASAAVVEQLERSEQTGELAVLLDAQSVKPAPDDEPDPPHHPDDRENHL